MATVRGRYQGVWNILRFNWHFYVLALVALFIGLLAQSLLPAGLSSYATLGIVIALVLLTSSLIVSHYVYDRSSMYTLDWINGFVTTKPATIANIHAGFDEFSRAIQTRFPQAKLTVLDFYDPQRHTEVSIKRARKAYPAFRDVIPISTRAIPLQDCSTDLVFLIFAAHEIRNGEERNNFFKEVRRILSNDGRVLLTEHLRDVPNLLAYNIGFFHFLSRASWDSAFEASGLIVDQIVKITPFVTTFVLKRHGVTS